MKPIIKVENLSKQYRLGENQASYSTLRDSIVGAFKSPLKSRASEQREEKQFWALRDVAFDVRQGEVVGIIGRNGAGKSTLLKILSRITEPTTGRIELYGRVGSLLEVGTGFHPELTGRENIFLNGAILGMKRGEIARKFDEIVAFAEIEKFIDTPVKFYYSGMYTRLAFAVAANLEPEILIVDEVLAVGDSEFQKKCLGKMKDVSQHGRTVLFVSHNMSAVAQLCTHGIMMRGGKIAYQGATSDVVEKYLTGSGSAANYAAEDNEDLPAQILWANIVDQKGEAATEFAHDDEITLKFGIKNFTNDREMRCAVGVWNLMDTLITVESREIEPHAGYKNYQIRIPRGYLSPNKLKFSVALYKPNKIFDMVTESLSFEIVDLGFKSLLKTEDFGLVHLKSKWEEIDA